jgi:hypothetical protein
MKAPMRVLTPETASPSGAAPGGLTSLALGLGVTSDRLSTKVGLLTGTNLRAFDTTNHL